MIISFQGSKIAWGGVEPPLPPYQSDVLPLHHRAPLLFCRIGTVGIEPTLSCSQDTRATGAPHPEQTAVARTPAVARMGIEPISPP